MKKKKLFGTQESKVVREPTVFTFWNQRFTIMLKRGVHLVDIQSGTPMPNF